jgi:hypothetical protein
MNSRFYVSFDVDLPTEVDDEYWENEHDPEQSFKQPPGKPSLLSYFVSFIKLNQTLAVALRTIVGHEFFHFWHTQHSHLFFCVVFDQQVKKLSWVCRATLGTAYCRRA